MDAIAAARSLIGTPYAQIDCINLIKKVIRTSPGGVPSYTTAGTNALWRSFEASDKYRDLTWRQESTRGAKPGMLAFKRSGDDVHHVGIVTDEGTVIHSSSAKGGVGVVETALDGTWDLLGMHRCIETGNAEEGEKMEMKAYRARVNLHGGTLNIRSGPDKSGEIIGRLNNGAAVTVLSECENGWRFISCGDRSGYVSGEYLVRDEEEDGVHTMLVLTDSRGNTWMPDGGFRAELRRLTD